MGFTPREYCKVCELDLALFLRWRRRLLESAEASSSSDSGVFLERGGWRIRLSRELDATSLDAVQFVLHWR